MIKIFYFGFWKINKIYTKSEDISLLKKEIEKGQTYLSQMAALREECARLSVTLNKTAEKPHKYELN